jgi:prephenate dehydrogenase
MNKQAVIGPGLLGGSIALAARRYASWRVSIWARREEAVAELRHRGIGDEASTDLAAVAEDADLVVLCIPIGAMPEVAAGLAPVISPGAVVTDVGSVKARVVAELEPIFRARGHFVGSHPMAGSDQAGLSAAKADLFGGSVCIVTPHEEANGEAIARVAAFWRTLGCRVRELTPEAHDETVALVSHLPHLVAAALVNCVQAQDPGALEFVGPGFRDTTRVAGGPPDMWTEILNSNRPAVLKSAEAMIAKLREFMTLLERQSAGDTLSMNEFLTHARTERERLRASH